MPDMGNEIRVVDPEVVLERATGRTITGWELDEEGLYLALDDGNYVTFIGEFIVSVVQHHEDLQ